LRDKLQLFKHEFKWGKEGGRRGGGGRGGGEEEGALFCSRIVSNTHRAEREKKENAVGKERKMGRKKEGGGLCCVL